jgi:predicted ATPase
MPFQPLPPTPTRRIKLLCSAEAMPFELFENVLTHEAYQQLQAGGGAAAGAGAPHPHLHAAAHAHRPGHGGGHAADARRGAHSGSGGGGGSGNGGGATGELLVDNELGFAKDRTISRLTEMQSLEYLAAHAEAHEPSLRAALREALGARRGGGAAPARAAAVGER